LSSFTLLGAGRGIRIKGLVGMEAYFIFHISYFIMLGGGRGKGVVMKLFKIKIYKKKKIFLI